MDGETLYPKTMLFSVYYLDLVAESNGSLPPGL